MLGTLLRYIKGKMASFLGARSRGLDDIPREGDVLIFRLLQEDGVQRELGLSGQQIDRLQEIIRESRRQHRQEVQSLRSQGREKFSQEMPAIRATVAAEVLVALERGTVLTANQKGRLQQIAFQNCGPSVFSVPAVQATLGLTEEQKALVRGAVDALRRKARESLQQDGGPGPGDGLASLRREAMSRALALLSEEQRQRWQELVGAPFECPPGGSVI